MNTRLSREEYNELSPLKAIKRYCYECAGCNNSEVRRCEVVCPLHQYRKGRRGVTRDLTDEQRAQIAERFKNARKQKEN